MPSIKKNKNPPEKPDKVSVLQENIRLVAKEVRTSVKTGKPGPAPSKSIKNVEPDRKQEGINQKQDPAPWENPYARELFFCKTNVRDVVREEIELTKKHYKDEEKKAASKDYRYRLFRVYVKTPKCRIMNPLHKVKFESAYYEYRCHLALTKGLQSEEHYQDYKAFLDEAGIQECWVDMSKDNLWMTHQDKVVKKVRKEFIHWNTKLEKLPQYVMDLQRKLEERQARKHANRISDLLDALLNRSNAPEMMTKEQIEEFYQDVFVTKPAAIVCFRTLPWLEFQDDELNRTYGLGRYLHCPSDGGNETDSETIIGITPLDHSVSESVRSEGSEIEQMRSEMAMTQPNEVILSGGAAGTEAEPFYQNTEEVITALEPTQQQQIEAFAPEPVASLVPPDDPMDEGEPQIVNRQDQQEDEPMPQQQEAVPAVADRQSGEEGSDFSLLTPGQQEVIPITDDSSEPSSDDDFWTNLDKIRKFTNIDEYLAVSVRSQFTGKMLQKKLAKLDSFVKKYFTEHLATFREKKLPNGIFILSRKERQEHEAGVVPEPAPTSTTKEPALVIPVPAPVMQSPPMIATPEPLFGGALVPYRDTPRPTKVPTLVRQINYENSPPLAVESVDTMPMPDSENFIPEISSTQVTFGGPMLGAVRYPGTPRPSPQRPSVDSRVSSPPFAAENFNETVLTQSPQQRRSSPRVKREQHSGYEDEVMEVPINNDPIPVNDSLSQSQIDGRNLIDQAMAQSDGVVGVPLEMQKRVAGLFRQQNVYDVTQTSQSSGGTSSGRPVLSQDHQSMGFRNSQSPSVRSN